MNLVVGLGNPGDQYSMTKHNVGFRVVDWLIEKYDCSSLEVDENYYRIYRYGKRNDTVLLVKPMTYMNRSGLALDKICRKKNIHSDDIIVICDDLYLPVGKLRLRKRGGDGGHKGLASIIEIIGHEEFFRLRFGIGNNKDIDASEYVLSPFSDQQKQTVGKMISKAGQAVFDLINKGIDWTMNAYN